MSSNITIPERPPGDPNSYTPQQIRDEYVKLSHPTMGALYFIHNYVWIFDNDSTGWIQFKLWNTEVQYDNQIDYILKLQHHKRVIVGKSRQVGVSLMTLAYFVYKMLLFPIQFALILSRGELESLEMQRKARNMYKRLPKWLQAEKEVVVTKSDWELSNGSIMRAVSSLKGDGFSSSLLAIDEADTMPAGVDLKDVMLRVMPTSGRHGTVVFLSKFDKRTPNSTFKNMFREALAGRTEFTACFIPWNVSPLRDMDWYNKKREESIAASGNLDVLHESYPATPDEALRPLETDKRLPFDWVRQCYSHEPPLTREQIKELYDPVLFERHLSVFSIPSLEIYRLPQPHEEYVVTADPAEGTSLSDMSALHVMMRSNKEECLRIATKCEPSTLAYYALIIGRMYNRAKVLPERNHHGHAFILWLRDNGNDLTILQGMDKVNNNSLNVQKRYGWATTSVSKATGYSKLADALRDKTCIIHSSDTFQQLCSIKESNLEAPPGQSDDNAVTYMLGIAAIDILLNKSFSLEFI